jgi:tetratricopeptide (TPR) repeat protein
VSEGVGEARTEAEGELALARVALDGGDVTHAASHAGNAIASDPGLRAAYALLDEMAAGTADAGDLVPMRGRVYIGTVLARSYLLAGAGALDEAFALLCQAAATIPGRPWAEGWLAVPGGPPVPDVASRLSADRAAQALQHLALSLTDPAEEELREPLAPFLDVARVVVTLNQERSDLLGTLSALARRLGSHDEAVAWCQRAEEADASYDAAVMLGYALRSAGRLDEMHAAWLRALERQPGAVDLRTDIAEALARRGRLDEAIAMLDEGLAIDPGHEKAFPAACEMRYARDGDIAHLVALADWWREHPEHAYAAVMLAKACHGRRWLGMVPPPTEAISNLLRNIAADGGVAKTSDTSLTLTLSALEVPSAMAAAKAALRGLDLAQDPATPDPDIRVPLAGGRYRLWSYAGATAVPAVPPPPAAAVAALHAVAADGYPPHPVAAYDAAVSLAGLPVAELLGLMAHVPPPPPVPWWQRMHDASPVYWPRSAQAWACLGLLHHQADEPWDGSARRAVLVDLLLGVEDWAADAAMNALVVAAWAAPAIRPDVAGLVAERFLAGVQAYQQREVTIIEPMAHLVLAAPGMHGDVAALARDLLARAAAENAAAEGQAPA